MTSIDELIEVHSWTSAKYSYSNAKTPYVEHVGVTKEKE